MAAGLRPRVQGQVLAEFQAGLPAGQGKRAKEMQPWLRRQHQLQLGLKGVYYWLGKLGGVWKAPRTTHAKKDAAQAVEFQQQLCAKLQSLNVAGGKAARIWVADEHRYGWIPVVRQCRTRRGERPAAPYQTQCEWGCLYSALAVAGAKAAQFLCLPRVDWGDEPAVPGAVGRPRSAGRTCGHSGSGGISFEPGTA